MFKIITLFLVVFMCEVVAKKSTPIRGCYATNWAQYRSGVGKFNLVKDYVPGICTHMFYAFAYVNSTTFQLYPTDPSDLDSNGGYAQLTQLKKIDKNLKTLISVGGATFDGNIFASAASSSSNLQTFAKNCITFAKKYNFDGVDLDWEYPSADQKSNLTSLLQALKNASNGLLITAAVSAGISTAQQAYDLPKLKNSVDFLNVMTYDYHGSWNSETGLLSPVYSSDTLNVNSSIQYYLQQGFPAHKLVLGIPTYGRGWTLSSNQSNQGINAPASGPSTAQQITQSAGIIAYYEACQILKGASKAWNKQGLVPYMQKSNQWYSYEDPTSVSWKTYYSYQQKLAGVFVWALDFDDFSGSCSQGTKYPLLNSIKRTLAG